jgi:hypothetical protein
VAHVLGRVVNVLDDYEVDITAREIEGWIAVRHRMIDVLLYEQIEGWFPEEE